MVVEWFLNDQPLYTGSRFRTQYDFGFIALHVKGAIAEDSGTYRVVARNALGEDSQQCNVTVNAKGAIVSDTQHEESIAKIEYLENLNKFAREEVVDIGPEVGGF